MSNDDFELFKKFIYDDFGLNFDYSKKHILEIKLQKLREKNDFQTCRSYFNHIVSTKNEQDKIEFLNEITVNKTDFFREINHFDFLKESVNLILKENPSIRINKEIRVWSSACSSGEEPYTIAMVLREAFPDVNIKILATDISYRVLEKAVKGVYPLLVKEQVPPYYLQKYFKRENDYYKVSPAIRDMVLFRHFNLKSPFPFKNDFDIIFCRNVMIYFDAIFQEKLINEFYAVTQKGGLLLIGHSESLSYIKHKYKYIKPTIYIKS